LIGHQASDSICCNFIPTAERIDVAAVLERFGAKQKKEKKKKKNYPDPSLSNSF
jgi:hypothetical protein